MRLILSLLLVVLYNSFSVHSQFSVGGFGGYQLNSRAIVGVFTEYSLDENWPGSIRTSYYYTFPYSKLGDETPALKYAGTDTEVSDYYTQARTKETFKHNSISIEYKQYAGDADASTGGFYGRFIIGLTFSKVTREWSPMEISFYKMKYDLFTITQLSLNLGAAMGYEFQLSDRFFIYGDILGILPFIKLQANSKEYDGFPEFSLGLQLGVRYQLF
ncbi:hypothetical protein [Fluviicola taffensis]|uniref:Outer membrane protein beta-barrel domain-containing protein n=1 Tax=Fluviicola taffensis (strain DSM 16823 / NCIMB 13979 / RW262) TaxID=755732 RepID=F2I9D4_FLUTR|nr:hypothetical protein [Fluviicola taffensis]AEA44091.1 hypothetical protein Fluta_2105 [Fluviicola taffensis DSM 16823]